MANRFKKLRECIIVEITDFCCNDFVAKNPSKYITKEVCSYLISRKNVFLEIMEYYSHDFLQKFREINFLTDKLH